MGILSPRACAAIITVLLMQGVDPPAFLPAAEDEATRERLSSVESLVCLGETKATPILIYTGSLVSSSLLYSSLGKQGNVAVNYAG